MVTLPPQQQAYLALLCMVMIPVLLILIAILSRRATKLTLGAEQAMRKHLLIEYLDRMRYRNFRGFSQVLNESRQSAGLGTLDERTLLRHQFDVKVPTSQLLESQ